MRILGAVVGGLLGALFAYVVGAALAWDFNPGEWGGLWRFIVLACALFWGSFFAHLGAAVMPAPKRKAIK